MTDTVLIHRKDMVLEDVTELCVSNSLVLRTLRSDLLVLTSDAVIIVGQIPSYRRSCLTEIMSAW